MLPLGQSRAEGQLRGKGLGELVASGALAAKGTNHTLGCMKHSADSPRRDSPAAFCAAAASP